MQKTISLSASKLNLLRECRRCFYDANVFKIERPRGIFPSLPNGVDRVMKEYIDSYRETKRLPPELEHLTGCQLWGNLDSIKKLRHWRSGLKATLTIGGQTVSIIGALDDLIVEADGTHSPYDTKTKGDLPKDDGSQYYQGQQDIYGLLLDDNGFPISGKGYLHYWYPVVAEGDRMTFKDAFYTVSVDHERAKNEIEEAVGLLSGGQPDWNDACEYCRFAQVRVEAAVKVLAGTH